MNRDNQYSSVPLSNREISYCGENSKVRLIDAGNTLVARIKQEHEQERQSRLRDSSENPHEHG
jgi:hypothetical protein